LKVFPDVEGNKKPCPRVAWTGLRKLKNLDASLVDDELEQSARPCRVMGFIFRQAHITLAAEFVSRRAGPAHAGVRGKINAGPDGLHN
jgi:hypothetical protein